MMLLTKNQEELKSFITDIKKDDDKLIIKYGNGIEETEKMNEHNLSIYHNRMIDQAKKYLPDFKSEISSQLHMLYLKRYIPIILGILSLFFLYNIDIHLIVKIILTILITLGEIKNYISNELELCTLDPYIREIYATEYYLNHIDTFKEFNSENYTDRYILPIEDITNYKLDKEFLNETAKQIENLKKEGAENITLSYKRKTES